MGVSQPKFTFMSEMSTFMIESNVGYHGIILAFTPLIDPIGILYSVEMVIFCLKRLREAEIKR